jgi:uncharacterized protein
MEFFDCNCWFGRPVVKHLKPAPTPRDLLAAMDRAGIAEALTWFAGQRDWSPVEGNRMLAETIVPHPRLWGCWALLPEETGELPAPRELVRQMARNRIRALRAFPDKHNYVLRAESVGTYLEVLQKRGIPLILSGIPWDTIYNLMRDFPKLTCIVCLTGCWGPDRFFRPLVAKYPNLCLEIDGYFLDGGIEAFVKSYGSSRLLFGSGFPDLDHGGMMLALKHAAIRDRDKEAIAAGNIRRILAGEDLRA